LVSVKTIAKVGRKFRSELTIDCCRRRQAVRVGQTSKLKYTIVSDGVKTWIYRPDTRQYVETTSSEFSGKQSAPIIGLFSLTFVSLNDEERQNLITDILGENNKLISLENFKTFQVSQQQIDKQNLSVYAFNDRYADNEVGISGFMNPQTVMFERIEFKFKDNQNRIKIVEKMIKRNSQPVITNKTFTFSPPKGVKKVKSLQIGPFKL
jgi:outer membrane lipoprotein-sorting protein